MGGSLDRAGTTRAISNKLSSRFAPRNPFASLLAGSERSTIPWKVGTSQQTLSVRALLRFEDVRDKQAREFRIQLEDADWEGGKECSTIWQ